jgi:zinc protease
VNFSYYTLDHTGPITIFAQTSAENLKPLQDAIFKELKDMERPDYFTDEQLENAKTILAINEKYGREEPSEFVHTVGFWWAVAGLDYYLNYVENLRGVTTEDIQRFLKTYVLEKPYIMGVLVSPEQREELGL